MLPITKISEAKWQSTVMDALHIYGYKTMHVYPLQTVKGRHLTPTSAVGWWDLTAIGRGFFLGIELKDRKRKITPEQIEWLDALAEVQGNVRAWLLRPTDDLEKISKWMAKPSISPLKYGY